MSPNHRKRMILVVVSVIAVFLLLYVSRNALFPFAIAGIFAYVLFPAVRGLERVMPWRNKHPDIARIAAIIALSTSLLWPFSSVFSPSSSRPRCDSRPIL